MTLSSPASAVWFSGRADFSSPLAACLDNYLYAYGKYPTLPLRYVKISRGTYGQPVGAQCRWDKQGTYGVMTQFGGANLHCAAGAVPSDWATGGCARPPENEGGLQRCNTYVGNPINVLTGSKFERVTDFSTEGPKPLGFTRYYNSQFVGVSELGAGWRSNFSRNFIIAGSSASIIRLIRGDGREAIFNKPTSSSPYKTAYWTSGSSMLAYPRNDVAWSLVKISTGWQFSDEDGTLETYDAAGKLISIAGPDGYLQTLTYNAAGFVSAVTDSLNRTISFTTSADGAVLSATAPDGTTYRYSYTAVGLTAGALAHEGALGIQTVLTKVVQPDATPGTDADNPTVTYHYEDSITPTALTGITDERGVRVATWTYNAEGIAISSEHAGGTDHVSIQFDYAAKTRTVTNPFGKTAIYRLASGQGYQQRLTSIDGQASSNCAASNTSYQYDTNGFLNRRVDGDGRVTTYTNDSKGRHLSETNGAGTATARTTQATWHATYPRQTQVVRPGLTTDFTYDSAGRVLQRKETDTTSQSDPYSTNGLTRIWNYTYNAAGLLAAVDGPRTASGDTTTYTYNSQGYVISVATPIGLWQVNAIDAMGRPTSTTDPNGVSTALTYDTAGRLTASSTAGLSTLYTYDISGRLSRLEQADGTFLDYTYDTAARLVAIQDQSGNRIEYDLDVAGNRIQERTRDADGSLRRVQSRAYDELGRLRQIQGANGQLEELARDLAGNVTSVTRAGIQTASNQIDSIGRLSAATDAAGGIVSYLYDGQDQVTSVTDPRGNTTSYVRNGFGEVIKQTSPDTGTTVMTYDSAGNLATRTDAKGQAAVYSHDASGRVTQIAYGGGNTVTYAYDQGSYGKGHLTGMTDASGSTSWTYDALGRVASKTQIAAGVSRTTAYGYDAAGHLISQTLPSGKSVSYTWSAGKISGISIGGVSIASAMTYEPFGPAKEWTFGNSQQATRGFDLSGRLTSYQLGTLGYDTADRITGLSLRVRLRRQRQPHTADRYRRNCHLHHLSDQQLAHGPDQQCRNPEPGARREWKSDERRPTHVWLRRGRPDDQRGQRELHVQRERAANRQDCIWKHDGIRLRRTGAHPGGIRSGWCGGQRNDLAGRYSAGCTEGERHLLRACRPAEHAPADR